MTFFFLSELSVLTNFSVPQINQISREKEAYVKFFVIQRKKGDSRHRFGDASTRILRIINLIVEETYCELSGCLAT